MNMYLVKKGYSQKVNLCSEESFNTIVLGDIFLYNFLIIAFFWCNKNLIQTQYIFVGYFFVTNSFLNFISN